MTLLTEAADALTHEAEKTYYGSSVLAQHRRGYLNELARRLRELESLQDAEPVGEIIETPANAHFWNYGPHLPAGTKLYARQLREREAKAEGLDDIHSCSYYCERPGCVRAQRDELRARLTSEAAGPASDPNVSTKYYELLFAVARKYPGESRHDTALKYIRRAEETTSVICSVGAALATKPGDGESR